MLLHEHIWLFKDILYFYNQLQVTQFIILLQTNTSTSSYTKGIFTKLLPWGMILFNACTEILVTTLCIPFHWSDLWPAVGLWEFGWIHRPERSRQYPPSSNQHLPRPASLASLLIGKGPEILQQNIQNHSKAMEKEKLFFTFKYFTVITCWKSGQNIYLPFSMFWGGNRNIVFFSFNIVPIGNLNSDH